MILKKRSLEEILTAAASFPKRRRTVRYDVDGFVSMVFPGERQKLKMVSGACYIPKDNPLKPQGEDAHFISADGQTVGVADGVGGWANKGVDAGEYARELMSNAFLAIQTQPEGAVNPKRILENAYSNTKAKGSSTACILTLTDYYIQYANVGDSGFMLFRDKKIVHKSKVQQRGFNCPYQLGNSKKSDRPSSAMEMRVAVIPGDVIVFGSDGLLDNVFPSEVEEMLNGEDGVEAEKLACRIAEIALYNSFDRFGKSPFSVAARKAGFQRMGGKVDDITVIVGYIIKENA